MTAPSIKEALELKPCPFCGTAPAFGRMIEPDQVTIGCNNDGCLVQLCVVSDVESEAVKAWNTRATFQPDGERREAIARIEGWIDFLETDAAQKLPLVSVELANGGSLADDLRAILASGLVQDEAGWQPIDTAPKDGTVIFVRRDNGCGTDYMVVWWKDTHNDGYPWQSDNNAYVEDRWDEWMLPPIRSARNGGAS